MPMPRSNVLLKMVGRDANLYRRANASWQCDGTSEDESCSSILHPIRLTELIAVPISGPNKSILGGQ
jgi:hypothetical protein